MFKDLAEVFEPFGKLSNFLIIVAAKAAGAKHKTKEQEKIDTKAEKLKQKEDDKERRKSEKKIKRKKEKKEGAIKRPLSAYMLYSNHRRPILKLENTSK